MSRNERNYEIAKEEYASLGVDTDQVLKKLDEVPISVHCWQIDDLQGWEFPQAEMTGGIAATGDAPGKARNLEEFMTNLSAALDLIPGHTKLALHAVYMRKHGKNIERNEIGPEEFKEWVDYAKERKIGLDFNPTYFSHPDYDSSATLTSRDEAIRKFWIEHGIACRKIGDYFGRELGEKCITNHWIGARATRRALMLAMLRPTQELMKLEREGNTTKRLALLEETKMMPAGFVWEYYCETKGIAGREWIKDLRTR